MCHDSGEANPAANSPSGGHVYTQELLSGLSPAARLITAIDAAALLCISTATLCELVKRDRLPCVEFVASGFRRPIRRYRLTDLIRFIDQSVG